MDTTAQLQALLSRMEALASTQQSFEFGQALQDLGPDAGEGLGRQGYQQHNDQAEALADSQAHQRGEGMGY